MSGALYSAALALADQAIAVFPCSENKAPLTPRGFHDATIDPQPEDYERAALIGTPTGEASGVNVLDIDLKGGGLAWLELNEPRLPVTRRVQTRSGGCHLYFRAVPGLRSSASKIAPGVDFRAEGAYVIAWAAAGFPVRHDETVAAMPEWLAEAARGSFVRHADNPARSAADLAPPNAGALINLLRGLPNPDDATYDTYTGVRFAVRGCIQGLQAAGDLTEAEEDEITELVIDWADKWCGSPGRDVEAAKWHEDISIRDKLLSGWQHLLALADRLGYDTRAARTETGAPEFTDAALAAVSAPTYAAPVLPEFTEDAAALLFAKRFKSRFVYDHTDKRWFEFSPAVGWAKDESGSIARTVRNFVRDARKHWGEAQSQAAAKIAFSVAVARGCESDERFAVTSQVWDADPWVLGVPGGSVDLRTGHMHPADSARFVLRRTTVAPAARGTQAPAWLAFLHDATGGDTALQAWLQRLLGYALTGDVSEEMFAFFYGSGGNGKGVLLHTVSSIFGNYAYQAPAELFKADSRTNREYQLARLDGIRLLLASETEAGADLAESFVKEITGNEGKINARNPHGRPFEFKPQAKFIIVGNHAPKLAGRSPAMERRLRVVPFDRKPECPDPTLKDRLVAEYPAILRWLIDGCLAWQRERLGTALAIGEASEDYFSEQDSLTDWLDSRCERGPEYQHSTVGLLESYTLFLRSRGERPVDARAFKESLTRIDGIEWKHTKTGKVYTGVRLPHTTYAGEL